MILLHQVFYNQRCFKCIFCFLLEMLVHLPLHARTLRHMVGLVYEVGTLLCLLTWSESLDFCDLRAVVMWPIQASAGPVWSRRVVSRIVCFWKCFHLSLEKKLVFVLLHELNQETHLISFSTIFHFLFCLLFSLLCFALPQVYFSFLFLADQIPDLDHHVSAWAFR